MGNFCSTRAIPNQAVKLFPTAGVHRPSSSSIEGLRYLIILMLVLVLGIFCAEPVTAEQIVECSRCYECDGAAHIKIPDWETSINYSASVMKRFMV